MRRRFLVALFIATSFAPRSLRAADRPKPKVRAITGFITIDALPTIAHGIR